MALTQADIYCFAGSHIFKPFIHYLWEENAETLLWGNISYSAMHNFEEHMYLPPEAHGWILKFYYKYLLAKKDFHITQYCCDVYDDGKSRMCLTSSECGYLQMCKRGDKDSKLLYHNTFVGLFLLPSLALFLFIEELLLLTLSKWDSDLKRLHLKALSFFTNIHVVISKTK